MRETLGDRVELAEKTGEPGASAPDYRKANSENHCNRNSFALKTRVFSVGF
jgi:hypothetical protein